MKKLIIFLCFLFSLRAFAYEKSGFFMGIQGGWFGNQIDTTKTQYNFTVNRVTNGTATSSGSTTQKGYFGTNVWGSSGGSFTTTTTSSVTMSANTYFSQALTNISDQPLSIGGVIGYKKIFNQLVNSKQFVGNNFNQNAFGMRYYLSFDVSAKGKNSKYSSIAYNGNIDLLYNLFPHHKYFDVGAFFGVSVGYIRHKMPTYEIKGLDYGLNMGVRWTYNERHTFEIYGRVGLSKLEVRDRNNKPESYYINDLSSTSEIAGDGSGLNYDDEVEKDGQKIYVGLITNQSKTSVDYIYADNYLLYYKDQNGNYAVKQVDGQDAVKNDGSDNVYTMESYNSLTSTGDRYSLATVTESDKTSTYNWAYTGENQNKKIYLTSSQSTFGGGTATQTTRSETILRTQPLDTIEEFRNPFKIGIRYTYTF